MPFQISALSPEPFEKLFHLSDAELKQRNIRRMTVQENPGTPCRVSLEDAEIGDTVLLLNYVHQPADTPYRSCHAIFVRQGVAQARLAPDEVPQALRARLMSVRLFDAGHMMLDADVVPGAMLAETLTKAFAVAATVYVHLHFAKPGCYAARVERR